MITQRTPQVSPMRDCAGAGADHPARCGTMRCPEPAPLTVCARQFDGSNRTGPPVIPISAAVPGASGYSGNRCVASHPPDVGKRRTGSLCLNSPSSRERLSASIFQKIQIVCQTVPGRLDRLTVERMDQTKFIQVPVTFPEIATSTAYDKIGQRVVSTQRMRQYVLNLHPKCLESSMLIDILCPHGTANGNRFAKAIRTSAGMTGNPQYRHRYPSRSIISLITAFPGMRSGTFCSGWTSPLTSLNRK